MRIICFSILLTVFLQGCYATPELSKARRIQSEQTISYSPVNGNIYRLPPRNEPSEESARAMPKSMAVSYSPLTNQTTLVKVNSGKQFKAKERPVINTNKPAVSYSPLSGEAVFLR